MGRGLLGVEGREPGKQRRGCGLEGGAGGGGGGGKRRRGREGKVE